MSGENSSLPLILMVGAQSHGGNQDIATKTCAESFDDI